jgi:hypothetical protein
MRVVSFFLLLLSLGNAEAQTTISYDFDTNIDGWSVIVSGTTVSFFGSDGDPTVGSLLLNDSIDSVQGYVLSPCIAIPNNTHSFSASVNAKIVSGISASFQVNTYSNSNCSGVGTPVSGRIPSNSVSWQTLQSGVASVIGNEQSIQILLFADVGSESILFDHLVVQFDAATPVRLQNFNVE